jgi:hypothetical protein
MRKHISAIEKAISPRGKKGRKQENANIIRNDNSHPILNGAEGGHQIYKSPTLLGIAFCFKSIPSAKYHLLNIAVFWPFLIF